MVFSRLPRLIIYTIPSGRDNNRPSTGTFKLTSCDKLHPDFKIRTIANTDGWGNKLVTIFARHLDRLILKQNFSLFYLNRDFGSGQILQTRQVYLSPGFAKIAPYPPRHRDSFLAKVPGQVTGWLRRVTFTPSTAGPLGLRDVPTNRDIQRTKVRVWLTPNTYFSCNFFVD